MLQRMQNIIKGKMKSRSGGGILFLGFGMLIGFMLPLMALGWDVNRMRIYKTDIENIAQMGMLSCTPHARNSFQDKNSGLLNCGDNIKGVILCNIHPDDRRGMQINLPVGVLVRNTNPYEGTYPKPCSKWGSTGKSNVIEQTYMEGMGGGPPDSIFPKPERRPGLHIKALVPGGLDEKGQPTKMDDKSLKVRIVAEYSPIFLPSKARNQQNRPVIEINDTSTYHVGASIVCSGDECPKEEQAPPQTPPINGGGNGNEKPDPNRGG